MSKKEGAKLGAAHTHAFRNMRHTWYCMYVRMKRQRMWILRTVIMAVILAGIAASTPSGMHGHVYGSGDYAIDIPSLSLEPDDEEEDRIKVRRK
jgi:hypothetical protein